MAHDERRLEVLRAIVQDYVSTQRPGRQQGPRRAARPRRLPGHHPQRHGGAGGAGLHHPAAHQRRPGAHRQGLPALRRPAVGGQAAVGRPSARRSSASSTAPSTCTTCSAARVRLLAQLTRQVAVVQYPTLSRSAVRHLEVVAGGRRPADAGADHRHRPGRAARRRLPGGHRRRGGRRSCARCSTPPSAASSWSTPATRCPSCVDDRAAAPARAGRHGQRHAAGDPRRAQRGPAGHRRDGEPRARQRAGLPRHGAAAAGGVGRTGRRPAVDGCRWTPSTRAGADRRGERPRGADRRLVRLRRLRLRPTARSAGSASSAPPAWTTQGTWPRFAPWPATSASCWPRAEAETSRWQPTTSACWAWPAGRSDSDIKRAYRKLARDLHPDVNPDPGPRSASRRSPAPTRR